MSYKTKLLPILQSDTALYRLSLVCLLVAGPAFHYLCFYNFFDHGYLQWANSLICFCAFAVSFFRGKRLNHLFRYVTIISFLAVNNFLLLSHNNFNSVCIFNSIAVFAALNLFCRKYIELVGVWALNAAAIFFAYLSADASVISAKAAIALLFVSTLLCFVSFLVMIANKAKFKKAVSHVMELNRNLLANDNKLREKRRNLNALMNSLNDVIFEFNEEKVCLNTWFRRIEGRLVNPEAIVGKTLNEVFGDEKAKKYHDAIDQVILSHQPVSFETLSDFNSGRWFFVRFSPVYDNAGNYTHRISVSVSDISEQKRYADALKENEALLTEAQTMAKTGNWWFDYESKESFWSQNLYSILEIKKIPEGSDKYEYYLSLVHPEDRNNVRQYFEDQKDDCESTLEHRIITPGGRLKFISARKGRTTANSGGKPGRRFGVLQDITEAKLAEKKIKVSEAELMEAQAIAKIGNWKWNLASKLLSWSAEINNIFGFDGATASGVNFVTKLLGYIHPGDRYAMKQFLRGVLSGASFSHECRIITGEGQVKYLSIIVGKLIKRENGTIKKIVGTLQDITDRKLAELEYQRTENKYRLVLETIKLPAVSVDKNGTVIFCNKYAADMLGYRYHEVLGLNWFDKFVPADHRQDTSELFERDSFKPQNINSVICRNGEQRIISWRNTISYDENGRIKEITGMGEDITERERKTEELISAKEQAERSSRFKSEFLSTMSHEIRTPMNAVIGTTNLLLSEDPKPEQMEYLNTLKFSGENLLAIINDILDYNKMEAGKLELNRIPFDIYHLSQRIKTAFYAKAAEKNIAIELSMDDRIPQRLIGDQIRLGQILNNLVSNAIKFTHSGKVMIRLEVLEINNLYVAVKFSITDTGIGISPRNLELIFEPFEQEIREADEHYGGTGLGLAITRKLIELHGSTISVSSELGRGTEFSFAINFQFLQTDCSSVVVQTTQPTALLNSSELQGMKILIVDDNKMNLLIASRFLKKWQADPDEATSGQQALEMAGRNKYDLIIMDLQMPGMDGFEASRIMKKNHPDIPIVALTADAMPDTYSKVYAAGMSDYVTKPFVPQTLFEKVARFYIPVED